MLKHLIAEAVALAGGNLCASGHEWESEGGRGCPKYENAGCSQTVYVCTRCGEYDYGGKGGPSHHECFVTCNRDFTDEIACSDCGEEYDFDTEQECRDYAEKYDHKCESCNPESEGE